MTLLVLAYLGGILTILSPCVLPVLPFVFARAGRPFASSILPMLVGMALTFAGVATLAAVGGGWVVQANEYGRIAALVLLAAFGLLLLWPRLADYATQPLVALGNRLSQSSAGEGGRGSSVASVILGAGTSQLEQSLLNQAGPVNAHSGGAMAGNAMMSANGAGVAGVPTGLVTAAGKGIEAAPDEQQVKSPETYVGYDRAQNFQGTAQLVKDHPGTYSAASLATLNQWGLGGVWTVEGEKAILGSPPGRIVFRFHARDLHLVLGPAANGKPVRFRVLLDGKPPGADHGVDADAQGAGTVTNQRLYQLIRQNGPVLDRTFTIEFQDPGVQAFSFTFG
jgi:cytochrome c biogenesis protein CcdA